MALPTFAQARATLLAHLARAGWDVRTSSQGRPLKTPHATSPDGRIRLWFRPQAVHYSLGTHHDANHTRSFWIDIRTTTPAEVERLALAEARR